MTLKAYVYDHGWSGAEVYITADKDKAFNYFRDYHLPYYENAAKNHNVRNGDNPWLKDVKKYKSGEFWEDIKVYDVVDGLSFETAGE